MKNVGQIGFDFGDADLAHRLGADWTWTQKPRSMLEHQALLAVAKSNLTPLKGIPQAVFSDVVLSLVSEHDRQVEWCSYTADSGEYKLWSHAVKFTAAEYETLIAHCIENAGRTVGGVEYKVRSRPSYWSTEEDVTVGMHVEGIGSLSIGRHSGKDDSWHTMHFTHAQRCSMFLQGYEDGAAYEYCSAATWAPAYSAQIIAEAYNKIPSVRTFKFGGREYVNTGASHSGEFSRCNAWAIALADDWTGDTFNYAEMTQAWDRGALERGDKRGLLVRVRGNLCVLERYMTVYDDQNHVMTAMIDEADEDKTDGFDDELASAVEEEEQEEIPA